MATATVNHEKHLKTEFVPARYEEKTVEVKTYTLTLSEDEAEALQAITWNVGGARSGGRGHTSNIGTALNQAGVIAKQGYKGKDLTGCIYFG